MIYFYLNAPFIISRLITAMRQVSLFERTLRDSTLHISIISCRKIGRYYICWTRAVGNLYFRGTYSQPSANSAGRYAGSRYAYNPCLPALTIYPLSTSMCRLEFLSQFVTHKCVYAPQELPVSWLGNR
uniref:Uncharacterized protein n=1 Tax=Cacopsylla melanoneura TaxID=428564 RepID=A0A8D8X636_9HEMI